MRSSLRGAHLIVSPLNSLEIEKFISKKFNNIILDLESATKFTEKDQAREFTKILIPSLRGVLPCINISVRINEPKYKSIFEKDIYHLIKLEPDFIRIPCVESAEDIIKISSIMSTYEYHNNKRLTTRLHVMIENPSAFINIENILSSCDRIHAVCLGGEDWANTLGLQRTKLLYELDFIRNWINIHASKYNLHSFDSIYPWKEDNNYFEIDCNRSRSLGFSGRAVKYVDQIYIANQAYNLPLEDIEYYKTIVLNTQFKEIEQDTFYLLNDKIIDKNLYCRARRSLEE
jgi:citrate lyase subunit beta/citryl-CoA lyase